MTELSPDYIEILESGLFSRDWYLHQYQDVAAAGVDPLKHYLSDGAAEGRDPGPGFSTKGYLSRYHDVAATGINPLLHYIRYGQKEGRLPTPRVDPRSIKRPYRNFGEYLAHSMLDPLLKAPFAEVDQNCFAFMEQVARWLCRKAGEYSQPPLVSVIMPVRDRAGVVGDAIRSVLGQSWRNFELIVVDDGSLDDSISIVRSFGDSRLRLLESGQPTGVSAARNRGLAAARGELIAYLDSDNTWLPDYLAAMAGAFQALPDADAAYGGQYVYKGKEGGEPFAVRFGCYNPSLLRNRNYIDLNCFVHRRAVLEAIGGGFCEEIRRWVDWELILRISATCKVYSVPILQSNYFLEKAENTITATEELEPARDYIMAKSSYCRQAGIGGCGEQLGRKVAIIVVADPSRPGSPGCLPGLESARVKTVLTEPGLDPCQAVNQALREADPDSDLLILDQEATLTPCALSALQQAAYADAAIAIAAPQQVLAGGETINTHVPYAFGDVPCDVTLSDQHRNVESLPLFHGGGPVELNFASFFCVYIKRDAWEMSGGLDFLPGGDQQSERVICEFVRHVLGRRIVYTPAAVVLHRHRAGTEGPGGHS